MDYVGGPEVFDDFNGGFAEFGIALGVVRKIAGGSAVDTVAIEIVGIVDEIVLDAAEDAAIGNGRKAQAGAHGNGEAGADGVFGFCGAIAWEDDSDFLALRGEGSGEAFDDVGETASFGKRQAFGGYEKDFHSVSTVIFGFILRYSEF